MSFSALGMTAMIFVIALLPLRTGVPGSGRLERFTMLVCREMEAAPRVRGPGAERPGRPGG